MIPAQIAFFFLKLSPVWRAFAAVWNNPIGKGVILTLAVGFFVYAYGERRASQAVDAYKAELAAKARGAAIETYRRIEDATTSGGGVDGARRRLCDILGAGAPGC